MPDSHKNFAYSTVATAPSPASSGTSLVVASGDGAKFPAPPFNATVWPAGAQPATANAEIVRVTAVSTDTLTIARTQEGTSARTITVGDQIAATITAKTLTDAESTTSHSVKANVTGTTQSIASGSWVAISWKGVDWDTDSFWASGSPTRLTVPTGLGGKYSILGGATCDNAANCLYMVELAISGTMQAATRNAISGAFVGPRLCSEFQLAAGDYVEVFLQQQSGSALALAAAELALHRLSA